MKKWIWIIVAVLLLGAGIFWFFMEKKDGIKDTDATSTIQTTTVKKGALEVSVSGSGSVQATTDQDVTADNTVLVIDSVSVASGETVSKGDTLLTFTNGDKVTAQNDGEISSVLVQSGGTTSKGAILFRLTNEDGITSPITRSNSNSETGAGGGNGLTVDTVQVKKGEQVKKGQVLANFTDGSILQAPVAGTLTSLSMESGDSVDSSKAVAHITNYDSLKTVISVDELDITKVKVKQKVEITASAFEGKTFTGIVTAVAKEGSSENGISTFDVTVKISNPQDLKIGMSTEAKILVENKEDALYVPVESIYTNDQEKYVLKPASKGDGSEKQLVETGIANDTNVEIITGLSEGDQVQLPKAKSSERSSGHDQMQQGGGFGGGQMPGGGQGGRPSGGGGPSSNGPSGSGGR